MALKITEECINCGVCEPECPNIAIYEGGAKWTYFGQEFEATEIKSSMAPYANDYYYIVPEKCTECVGFHDEPQCAAVCPVDCCVPDEDYPESEEELLAKKDKLLQDPAHPQYAGT
jgi:ferredoxin